jgi:hypothetical protein
MSEKLDGVFIHKKIKEVFDEVYQMKRSHFTNKEPYIRPSMAPACSIKMFMKICKGLADGGRWEVEENFMMDYYTSVGTTTHEVFQKWFGYTGKLLGDWSCTCRGTKKIKKILGRQEYEIEVPKVISRMTFNSMCPKCGKQMKYEELEIDVKGLTGHVDGVLEFIVNKKKCHIVIDYKGTTAEKIKNYKPGNPYTVFPDPKHTKQIGLYAYALNNYYGLNVIGHALLYTSRDTPIPKNKICAHFLTEEEWEKAEEIFKGQLKQIRVLNKTLEDGRIERLMRNKLCPDYKYYSKNVKSRFSECDYCDICFSAPKQMSEMLKDASKSLKIK